MRRISPGVLILGIFAVLFGLVGAYAAKKHLQAQKVVVAEANEEPTLNVPMAVTDLPAGRMIAVGDVASMKLTRAQMAQLDLPSAFMTKALEIVGRTLRTPVNKGQAFDPETFYPKGLGPDVADRLEPGERAVTVPFEGTASTAGLIKSGSNVDVLFRTNAEGVGRLSETTVTLLENVKVLAVGGETCDGATVKAGCASCTVTLAVSAMQARALKVVEDRGTMTLVLRNAEDEKPAYHEGPSTLPELLGIQEPEEPFTTEFYRGGRLTTVAFQEGRREVLYEETPYGMPVATEPKPVPPSDVTVTGHSATLTSHTKSGADNGGAGKVLTRPVSNK